MNTVEPIRDINKIFDIAEYLRDNNERNYIMFMVGIYSGLRISDILQLRIRDIRGQRYIRLREKKTGKEKTFPINKQLRKVLDKYMEGKRDYEFLIRNPNTDLNKPISRQQAYSIICKTGKKFQIDNLGTHTLRKTFGYHFYKSTGDIAMLMKIFNHHDEHITLRYIGIEQESMNSAMESFDYGYQKRKRMKEDW